MRSALDPGDACGGRRSSPRTAPKWRRLRLSPSRHGAQLLPCVLLLPGRADESCRLLLTPPDPLAAATAAGRAASTSAEASAEGGGGAGTRRDLLLLVERPGAAAPAAPTHAAAPAPASAAFEMATSWMPGGAQESAPAAAASAPGAASAEWQPREAALGADGPAARVVLSLPLHALTLSVAAGAPGGSRLTVSVSRPHAPPGVSAERPLQLEFMERWRCAAAKAQLEQGCAAARAAQNERLAASLRAEPEEPRQTGRPARPRI